MPLVFAYSCFHYSMEQNGVSLFENFILRTGKNSMKYRVMLASLSFWTIMCAHG